MSKDKKDKTPFILKLIRWYYPKLERWAPGLAYRYFIKIFMTPFRYPVPEKEKEMARKADLFSITVAGKRVQAYRWGQGPTVLMVHGWAGRALQFRKFVEVFTTNGFQVIAFDGPAHGLSKGRQTNILEFDLVLKELVKETPPVAVITHSFGGVAALFSMANGLPVKRLINIASPTIGDEVINSYLRAINGTWKSGNFFKEYMVRHFGRTFDEVSGLYSVMHLPQPVDLLLIYDEDDKEVGIIHAEELVRHYPAAKLVRTRGLGHTRILKDEQVIETCLRFVAS